MRDEGEQPEEQSGEELGRPPKKARLYQERRGEKRSVTTREEGEEEDKKRRENQAERDTESSPDPMMTEIIQALMNLNDVDLAEVYSPPRVTRQAVKYGLRTGEAMDLTTRWDFARLLDRIRASEDAGKYKPRLLVGSPMCTMFSSLQNLSPWTEEKKRRWGEAREHIRCVDRMQLDEGRLFLREHPAGASSWDLEEMKELMSEEEVHTVRADQCMYGLTTCGRGKSYPIPAMQPTKFCTNSRSIARELSKRCDGQHEHQTLLNGRAKDAARYLEGLCRAICRGLMKDMRERAMNIKMIAGVGAERIARKRVDPNEHHDLEEEGWSRVSVKQIIEHDGAGTEESTDTTMSTAWDDVTGMELDAEEVRKARRNEIDYVRPSEGSLGKDTEERGC